MLQLFILCWCEERRHLFYLVWYENVRKRWERFHFNNYNFKLNCFFLYNIDEGKLCQYNQSAIRVEISLLTSAELNL